VLHKSLAHIMSLLQVEPAGILGVQTPAVPPLNTQ
jgi:hypothetical protein